MSTPRVRIQQADFDVAQETRALHAGQAEVGAVVAFLGTVRGSATSITAMELEHYPGMTESAIEAMIDQAHARFAFFEAAVIHRVGRLEAGAQIVWVGVAARHRREAFEACEFLMDYLKTQAPFWKKEHTAAGAAWVDAREADDAALRRWGVESQNA